MKRHYEDLPRWMRVLWYIWPLLAWTAFVIIFWGTVIYYWG